MNQPDIFHTNRSILNPQKFQPISSSARESQKNLERRRLLGGLLIPLDGHGPGFAGSSGIQEPCAGNGDLFDRDS